MSKIWTIITREYKASVYKKSFLIGTILTPILMLGAIFLPAVLSQVEVEDAVQMTVIDQSGLVEDKIEDKLDKKLPDGTRKFIFNFRKTVDTPVDTLMEQIKYDITENVIDGLIYIPETVIDSAMVEFYARNVGNFDLNRQIRNAINSIIVDHRIYKSGLDPVLIKQLTKDIGLRTIKIKKGEEEQEGSFIQDYFVTLAFIMILYLTILLYGASIMRGILEEKNSRVIEILLSSANSFQLMAGKIIGLGSVGLTQYLIWSVLSLSILLYGTAMTGMGQIPSINPVIFIYFVVFFILGYFLYATLYAAFGAMTNTDQEAQQASLPVVMLLIIPLIMMTFIVKNPESTTSVVLSIIPFFSPLLMFARVNISNPPFIEVGLSILLLIVTIIISMWIVGRIYRVGILMYGKKPTLQELIRWMKTK